MVKQGLEGSADTIEDRSSKPVLSSSLHLLFVPGDAVQLHVIGNVDLSYTLILDVCIYVCMDKSTRVA